MLLPAKKSSNIGSDKVVGTPTYSEAICPLLDELMSINDSSPPPTAAAAVQVGNVSMTILH